MKKALGTILICILLIVSSLVIVNPIKALKVNGNTLYVGGSGPGNYTTIQDAIDNASDSDTVFVFDGIYYENVILDNSIYLIGEDKDTTIIDSQDNGTTVTINADSCLVSNFSLINCEDQIDYDWRNAVIKINGGNNAIIKDNILNAGDGQSGSYNYYGAIELNGCIECSIINNYIGQNKLDKKSIGIILRENSSTNIISRNNISNYRTGVETLDENDRDNTISDNHIHHNVFGIQMMGVYNEILNNKIEYNTDVGINIQNSYYNTISGNIVQYNGESEKFHCGIELMGDYNNHDNFVSDNIISYNKPCGLQTEYSNRNIITMNNFINNYGEDGSPERWWGNAYVHVQDGFFKKDKFKNNYWSDSVGFFPKIIYGIIEVIPHVFSMTWINIDWHPAKEPYDIT